MEIGMSSKLLYLVLLPRIHPSVWCPVVDQWFCLHILCLKSTFVKLLKIQRVGTPQNWYKTMYIFRAQIRALILTIKSVNDKCWDAPPLGEFNKVKQGRFHRCSKWSRFSILKFEILKYLIFSKNFKADLNIFKIQE